MTKTTKRSLMAICIAILLAATCFAVLPKMSASAEEASTLAVNAEFGGGSGTAADPYLIYNATQLYNIRYTQSWNDSYSSYRISKSFKLMNDITLTNSWIPIPYALDGTLYGEGHTIYNLTIQLKAEKDSEYYGLFEEIGKNGSVQNITFDRVWAAYSSENTSAYNLYMGAVAGTNLGKIIKCTVIGTIKAVNLYNAYIGSIAGSNSGTISNCTNNATVGGSGSIGGIAGVNFGTITGCTNFETVIYQLQSSSRYTGGIVGVSFTGGSVTNCTNEGKIESIGALTFSTVRPCMAQIVGWLQGGSCTSYTLGGSVDFGKLFGNQLTYCSQGAIGRDYQNDK